MQKQFIKPVLCLLTIATFLAMNSSSVFAQLSPAISPWMGMFDRNRTPGTLDNYNRLVKPQQNMLKAYAAQANQIQNQQQALQALQDGGGGSASGARNLMDAGSPSGKTSPFLSPPREIPSTQSNPAGFNQYLHYYPTGSMARRPVPNFSTPGRRR